MDVYSIFKKKFHTMMKIQEKNYSDDLIQTKKNTCFIAENGVFSYFFYFCSFCPIFSQFWALCSKILIRANQYE